MINPDFEGERLKDKYQSSQRTDRPVGESKKDSDIPPKGGKGVFRRIKKLFGAN
jgi:hypothetical protein